jgi:hypothetical protein
MNANASIDEPLPLEQMFGSAHQLRVYKTKLTRTAVVLADLANPQGGLGQLLKADEHAVLNQSIAVIQSFSQRIEKAKECKLQDEKALEQAFNARQAQSWKLTKAYFPLVHETQEQQVNGLCMAMCLNQLGLLKPNKTASLFKAGLLKQAEALGRNYGSEYFFHELFSDCQAAIQEHIATHSAGTAQQSLDELRLQVAELSIAVRDSEKALLLLLSKAHPPQIAERAL